MGLLTFGNGIVADVVDFGAGEREVLPADGSIRGDIVLSPERSVVARRALHDLFCLLFELTAIDCWDEPLFILVSLQVGKIKIK